MRRSFFLNIMIAGYFALNSSLSFAESILAPKQVHSPKMLIIPSPPLIRAKAYILIDTYSGKIIAEKHSDKRLPPASLTKMMTLYVASNALKNEQIHLDDKVHISKKAWKMTGSKMFIKEGQNIAISDLLQGIIVDSGNDACVAMAEYLGGSEAKFATLMNQQAQLIGMSHSHFMDSTGLPDKNHFTTAKDLALLGVRLIHDFPQYYHWYGQKWFTFNQIKQPNRNRLLWRDESVDGIKTGHTDEAGFCLVSSAKRHNMRLLAVVMGSPSEAVRAEDSSRLLNYGFRFYETHKLYSANQTITKLPVYYGQSNELASGLLQNAYITIPTGQYNHLTVVTETIDILKAPIRKHQKIGYLVIRLDDQVLDKKPLYALNELAKGGYLSQIKDMMKIKVHHWIS